jgi:GTP 3',8-cyclase
MALPLFDGDQDAGHATDPAGAHVPRRALREPAPPAGLLVDTFGRVASDLRVSVVDKCNFRCTYCMPEDGLPWLSRDELLTVDEIERLVALFVNLGVDEVKLTGGEPLARREFVEIVARIRELEPSLDISVTTNGYLLERVATELRDAGLDRVSVSCDSLLRHRFADMTRRDALDQVMAGLRAADAAGFEPIKLNCVVIEGTNDDEIVDFARFSRETGYEVRFIEYMPLDADHAWERAKVVPSREILEKIGEEFPLVADDADAPQPARVYRFADGAPGGVGVIASVTEPFCDTCNRLRITPDGQLRSCLFSLEETDLRGPLRAGADDGELERLVRATVWRKWAGHRIDHPDFVQPARSMSMIGG